MGKLVQDDGWRLPEALWAKMKPLLPERPRHPLGCHNPRVDDRAAMDGIFFVLRTGCQWAALDATGICKKSSAHRRFMEWTQAGVFEAFWRQGLLAYDAFQEIDWTWLSADAAMTKAPLGGEKTGPNPTDRGKSGTKRSVLTDGRGVPRGRAGAGAPRNDHQRLEETHPGRGAGRPAPGETGEQHLCLDKGFDYESVETIVEEQGFVAHIRRRGEDTKALPRSPASRPRRWVVERAHSWLNRFRRILVRWEKRAVTYIAMLQLACALTAWENAGLPG